MSTISCQFTLELSGTPFLLEGTIDSEGNISVKWEAVRTPSGLGTELGNLSDIENAINSCFPGIKTGQLTGYVSGLASHTFPAPVKTAIAALGTSTVYLTKLDLQTAQKTLAVGFVVDFATGSNVIGPLKFNQFGLTAELTVDGTSPPGAS